MAVPSRVGAPCDPRRGFGEDVRACAAQDGPLRVSVRVHRGESDVANFFFFRRLTSCSSPHAPCS